MKMRFVRFVSVENKENLNVTNESLVEKQPQNAALPNTAHSSVTSAL